LNSRGASMTVARTHATALALEVAALALLIAPAKPGRAGRCRLAAMPRHLETFAHQLRDPCARGLPVATSASLPIRVDHQLAVPGEPTTQGDEQTPPLCLGQDAALARTPAKRHPGRALVHVLAAGSTRATGELYQLGLGDGQAGSNRDVAFVCRHAGNLLRQPIGRPQGSTRPRVRAAPRRICPGALLRRGRVNAGAKFYSRGATRTIEIQGSRSPPGPQRIS